MKYLLVQHTKLLAYNGWNKLPLSAVMCSILFKMTLQLTLKRMFFFKWLKKYYCIICIFIHHSQTWYSFSNVYLLFTQQYALSLYVLLLKIFIQIFLVRIWWDYALIYNFCSKSSKEICWKNSYILMLVDTTTCKID